MLCLALELCFGVALKDRIRGGILKALPLQMDEEDRNHFPAFKRSLCFKCACHYVGMKMRWMHLLACV